MESKTHRTNNKTYYQNYLVHCNYRDWLVMVTAVLVGAKKGSYVVFEEKKERGLPPGDSLCLDWMTLILYRDGRVMDMLSLITRSFDEDVVETFLQVIPLENLDDEIPVVELIRKRSRRLIKMMEVELTAWEDRECRVA
nr:hypothetical protein [Tanacetum cinerariifolium]